MYVEAVNIYHTQVKIYVLTIAGGEEKGETLLFIMTNLTSL